MAEPAQPTGGLVQVGRTSRWIQGPGDTVREVWRHRELLGLLVRRELKTRYKDSALGFLWTLIRPLTLFAVYYLAIGRFLGAERSIPEFALFVFAGLTFWFLFTEIVMSATSSVVGNAGLVRKVYFPRELFPLSGVGVALVNFAVQLAILVTVSLALGFGLDLAAIATYLVPAVAATLMLATGIGLIAAALNVYLRDVQYLVEVVFLIGFWLAPIVYSWQLVQSALGPDSGLADAYLANPLAILALSYQRALWPGGSQAAFPPDLGLRLAAVVAASVLVLWVGERVFTRLSGNFAQEL